MAELECDTTIQCRWANESHPFRNNFTILKASKSNMVQTEKATEIASNESKSVHAEKSTSTEIEGEKHPEIFYKQKENFTSQKITHIVKEKNGWETEQI